MDVKERLAELLKQTKINKINGHTVLAEACFTPNVFENMANNLIAHGVTMQEWYSAENPPKEEGTYLVQTTKGTITTARFYAFKSFPATKYLPAFHRSACWQSNRNVVRWTYLPQLPEFDK